MVLRKRKRKKKDKDNSPIIGGVLMLIGLFSQNVGVLIVCSVLTFSLLVYSFNK